MLHKILGKNLYNLPSKNHLTKSVQYGIMENSAPEERWRPAILSRGKNQFSNLKTPSKNQKGF
jgi:hypothetical protein